MMIRSLILASAAALSFAAPAQAATVFNGTGSGFLIPFGVNTQTSTITLADPGKVQSVTFQLNLLTHTAARDLTATVTHNGVTALLFGNVTDFRGLLGDYNFTNTASTLLKDGGGALRIAPGTYKYTFPTSSSFVGTNVAGDWTLSVQDNRRLGVGGMLNWSLSGMGAVPEPTTWAMMIFGFGAVGSAMRRRNALAKATVRFA